MKHKVVNYFGWYGVMAILAAYALLNLNVITVHSYAYQLLNLSGALGVVIEALSKKDVQPAILNVIWACIALAIVVKLILGY
jgi:hypothetical protein